MTILESKEMGDTIPLKSMTVEELKQLWVEETVSDQQLAELFGVSKSTVGRRRRALGIGLFDLAFEQAMKDPDMCKKALSWLHEENRLNDIAKAVTHFAFRNGPVENMHARGKLNRAPRISGARSFYNWRRCHGVFLF